MMTQQEQIDDLIIQALVDNELTQAESERFFARVMDDPVCRCRYEQLKAQKEALRIWWENSMQ